MTVTTGSFYGINVFKGMEISLSERGKIEP
jgi:hypothetical protein